MNTQPLTYGEKLKSLRKAAGLEQSELAEESGIPIGTIRNHEQDRGTMSIDHMFAYCKAMKVGCDSFEGCRLAKEDKRITPNPPAKTKSKKKK